MGLIAYGPLKLLDDIVFPVMYTDRETPTAPQKNHPNLYL